MRIPVNITVLTWLSAMALTIITACKREISNPQPSPAANASALAATTSRLNFLSGTVPQYPVSAAVVTHPLPGQQSAKFKRPAGIAYTIDYANPRVRMMSTLPFL